jgi:uncharacterized membrane protein (UPF0127 family)
MRKWLNIVFFTSFLVATAAGAFQPAQIRLIGEKEYPLSVELAISPEERQQGLMQRRTVKPFDGMLFDFGNEQTVAMWMKNTHIPLDMVFFDEGRKVVHIHYDAIPHSLAVIQTPAPARYVLELPAGDANRYGIKTGHIFELLEK